MTWTVEPGPLELFERDVTASRVESGEAFGLTCRRGVKRRRPNAHAFERQHQHWKRSEAVDGSSDVCVVDCPTGEHAVRKREEVEPPLALPRLMAEDHLGERDRIRARFGREPGCGGPICRSRVAKDTLPEGLRSDAARVSLGGAVLQPGEKRPQICLWPDERRGADFPLGERPARQPRQSFQ